MEKIFALYDSDIDYATRFMEYFKGKNNSGFIISAFTRKESLQEYLNLHTIDILLLGEQINTEELSLQNVKHSYRLTGKSNKKENSTIREVAKYQSASAIITEIISDYMEKENIIQSNITSDQINVISIFSPVSGLEKLTFSWAVSSLLSEQKKVLLVLLDLLPIHMPVFQDKPGQSLTDFIYYLKGNSNIAVKLNTLPKLANNLFVLSGIIHGADLLSLCKEDIDKWLDEIRMHTDYQTIIFHIGYYTDAMIELMKLSDTVLALSIMSPYETEVLKEWERQMDQIGINTKQEKYRYITLQREDSGNLPTDMADLTKTPSWIAAYQYLNYE